MLVEGVFHAQNLLGLDGDIRGLPLKSAHGLVDHDARVGQGIAFFVSTGSQQECPHAGGLADAHGGDIGFDVLHGIVNRQPGGDDATRRVDVKLISLSGSSDSRNSIWAINRLATSSLMAVPKKDNTVFQESRIDVVGPLSPAGLVNDHRN
jgi:hypothetical protein